LSKKKNKNPKERKIKPERGKYSMRFPMRIPIRKATPHGRRKDPFHIMVHPIRIEMDHPGTSTGYGR
jgi:hypothetical protein